MAQQQQQQQGGDNSLAPVWITVLLFFTVYIIWREAHQYIVSFVFYLNILQAKLVNLVLGSDQLKAEIFYMQTADPSQVDFSTLAKYTRSVGFYMRYPIVVILVLLAVVLYRSDITLRFRRAHNMKTLREQEQHNWSAIKPVIKENLVDEDISKGPWAMAMTPLEFAKKHDLLKKNDILMEQPLPGMELTAGIRRGDAKRVFTLQLGPYWDGIERCSPHAMALAAVFMARINRDRGAAQMILKSIDETFSKGKPDFSIARPIIKKYYQTELVQDIVQRHAYMLTVMASLLEGARDDGVVPSSEFLWLKVVDRRLWYMLNCVGRQTPFSEVGGPFAHWKAEKEIGRRSLLPMIDEAIKALEMAVKEVKLTPKEIKELQP